MDIWTHLGEDKKIILLLGLVPWIGGDSAKITYKNIQKYIPFLTYSEFKVITEKLKKSRILFESRQLTLDNEQKIYELSSKGANAVILALFEIISYWSIISTLLQERKYATIQYFFISNKRFSVSRLKSSFILEYSNLVLEKLAYLGRVSFSQYDELRIFLIRSTILPVKEFVTGEQKNKDYSKIVTLVNSLLKIKVIKFSKFNGKYHVLLFKDVIMRDKAWPMMR